ncbi:MAG: PspA/IM30 family protein [Chromatiales bacterium]|jgi:phage shock protein A|nr:PspA/IM30 family protein [Chromatiales bacterium]
MNVWAKMMTALRGGVNEAGEAVVDSQALRILDQEVRDASDELQRSRGALAQIMARQKVAEEKCGKLGDDIREHETYAVRALDQGEEALALEVAQKIADFENALAGEETHARGFEENAEKLRAAIRQAERNIKHLKQQVDTVKAVDNVQRAQAAVAERFSGSDSKLRTAMESLERIKEKQSLKSAQISAGAELAEELSETSLQSKLEDAGITSSGSQASDVLTRLKGRGK